jgi:hypothetical protein
MVYLLTHYAVCFICTQLPDGRIFGEITQNRPLQIFLGCEKLVAGKWTSLPRRVAEKRSKNLSKQCIVEIPSGLQFFQCFLIIKASKTVNKEQFIP